MVQPQREGILGLFSGSGFCWRKDGKHGDAKGWGAGWISQGKGQMGTLGLLKPISATFGPELPCGSLTPPILPHPVPTTPDRATVPQAMVHLREFLPTSHLLGT